MSLEFGTASLPMPPERKRREKKKRITVDLAQEGRPGFVRIYCYYGCGRVYETKSAKCDKKEWSKALRRLNAHESGRCRNNPALMGTGKMSKRLYTDNNTTGRRSMQAPAVATRQAADGAHMARTTRTVGQPAMMDPTTGAFAGAGVGAGVGAGATTIAEASRRACGMTDSMGEILDLLVQDSGEIKPLSDSTPLGTALESPVGGAAKPAGSVALRLNLKCQTCDHTNKLAELVKLGMEKQQRFLDSDDGSELLVCVMCGDALQMTRAMGEQCMKAGVDGRPDLMAALANIAEGAAASASQSADAPFSVLGKKRDLSERFRAKQDRRLAPMPKVGGANFDARGAIPRMSSGQIFNALVERQRQLSGELGEGPGTAAAAAAARTARTGTLPLSESMSSLRLSPRQRTGSTSKGAETGGTMQFMVGQGAGVGLDASPVGSSAFTKSELELMMASSGSINGNSDGLPTGLSDGSMSSLGMLASSTASPMQMSSPRQ